MKHKEYDGFFVKAHQCQKADMQRYELLMLEHSPLLSSMLIFLATNVVFKMSLEYCLIVSVFRCF